METFALEMATDIVMQTCLLSSSSKFLWKIDNFSKLKDDEGFSSNVFSVGPFKWIAAAKFTKGETEGEAALDHLSLVMLPVDLPESVYTNFSFVITSQTDPKNRVRSDLSHKFTKTDEGYGRMRFMPLSELFDLDKGYIVNDTCIIRVELSCSTEDGAIEDVCDDMGVSDTEKAVNTKTKMQKLNDGGEYASAGQPFCKGRQNYKAGFREGKGYEDVGGFSILKAQVQLYNQIWSKYGHIPSTKVMPISSYHILVMVVKDLMTSIIDTHQRLYVDLSPELIEGWEEKIRVAEAMKFNIGWLLERFEKVKKCIGGMQKVKTGLLEHGQPLRAARSRVETAEDKLKKAQARLLAASERKYQDHSWNQTWNCT